MERNTTNLSSVPRHGIYGKGNMLFFKGTVMQTEKALTNDRLRVLKVC